MDNVTLLSGTITATTNLAVGGLFFAFWFNERPARWNLWWGIGHVLAALEVGSWVLLHPADARSFLLVLSLLNGAAFASLIAGVSLFLAIKLRWIHFAAMTLVSAGLILLASHFSIDAAMFVARLVYGIGFLVCGIGFLRQSDRPKRALGAIFLARALQLFLAAPISLAGYGAAGFIAGHFMALATGFGLLFVGFRDYSRRLEDAKNTATAQNVTLSQRGQDLLEANRLLSDMAVRLELKNVEYAEARDRAHAASQAKSQFLANMSHELRTPLNAVIGFSELMLVTEKTRMSATAIEYVGHVRTAGEHLLKIVNDLLDLARIELNAIELVPEAFRLLDAVEHTLSLLHFALTAKQVSAEIDIPQELRILGDDRLMKQVLTNLIGNAIKFSPAGEQILVRARLTADGGAIVNVTDAGPGIEEADRERVFERFWQKADVMTRDHGGIGLGLSIARQIVAAHGGTLHIEAGPASGTAAVITFPPHAIAPG